MSGQPYATICQHIVRGACRVIDGHCRCEWELHSESRPERGSAPAGCRPLHQLRCGLDRPDPGAPHRLWLHKHPVQPLHSHTVGGRAPQRLDTRPHLWHRLLGQRPQWSPRAGCRGVAPFHMHMRAMHGPQLPSCMLKLLRAVQVVAVPVTRALCESVSSCPESRFGGEDDDDDYDYSYGGGFYDYRPRGSFISRPQPATALKPAEQALLLGAGQTVCSALPAAGGSCAGLCQRAPKDSRSGQKLPSKLRALSPGQGRCW